MDVRDVGLVVFGHLLRARAGLKPTPTSRRVRCAKGAVHNVRHSGESRRFSGRNVHPEGPGNGDAHVI